MLGQFVKERRKLNKSKMTIAIAKEAFNRKISLLTSKLNIKLRKKLVRGHP